MKVAYLSKYDSQDIRKWSGLVSYIFQSLEEQGVSVESVGPLREEFSLLLKGKQYLYKKLYRKDYMRDRDPLVLNGYSKQIRKKISGTKCDILFSQGTVPIAHLEDKRPIVFWTDACFASMLNFYPRFSNLCEETIRNGHEMEKQALEKSSLAIYSSEWAARTAIDFYGVEESKIKVVPFGANIECDRNITDINKIISERSSSSCNLLFLGVDWVRKGGDIALEVAKKLNADGLETKLTIVGCDPPKDTYIPDFVDCLGFIGKSSEDGVERLNSLFRKAHFLIVPSRAECYGIVFCEANSFGVPCISTDVGGIPTVIKNELNGRTFRLNSKTHDYCEYISDVFSNYSRYCELASSSFHEYKTRLNWSTSGHLINKMLIELLDKR